MTSELSLPGAGHASRSGARRVTDGITADNQAPPLMRLPFVARTGAFADITAALDGARHARGSLVLITGEPGIGKTRLAEEVANHAQGFRVIWTWCTAAGVEGAMRPWSMLVRSVAAADAGAARAVQQSPHLAELVTAGTHPDARHADPETARWRLSLDLVGVLAASAASQPTLVVIDDLHEADPSSLQLLTELAPSLRSMAVVVLATARDSERDWSSSAQVWGVLNRLGHPIRLGPFDKADIASLLAQALGMQAPAEAVRTIAARTQGNPLLVCEVVRSRPDLGDLDAVVPASVRAIVAARLVGSTELTRTVVSAAAVLGTRFRLDVLAEVAEVPLAELGAVVGEAHAVGLFGNAEPGEGRFRHDLIRDAGYDALPVEQRMRWHARAGAVLAVFAQRGRDIEPAQVADHLFRGGLECGHEAVEFAVQAADQALRRLAFEDAVRWYSRADAGLALVGAGDEQRARVKLALGEARHAAGDRAQARSDLLAAAERARRAGRPDLLAQAALGLSAGPVGFEVELLDQEQIVLLKEARAALPADADALAALVTARLSIALTLLATAQQRQDLAEEAVRAARRIGDDGAVAASLAALCDALSGPDHCSQRRQYATEIVTLGQRLHDPAWELLGRRLRLVALLEAGAMAEADAEVLAYRTAAQSLGHPLYLWYVPLWRGMRALLEGRYDDCRAALDETAALGARAASHNADMLLVTQRWCLLAELGDRESLTAMWAQFGAIDMAGIWPQIARGLLLAQLGLLDDARAQLDATAPQLPSAPRDSEWLPLMAQVAELVGIIGAHPAAMWAYEALLPYAELFVVEGIGAAVRGPVHYPLGLLAAAMGDRAAAAPHFAAASQAARAVGAPRLAERIRAVAGGRNALTDNVFRRDGDYWTIRHRSAEFRLRDSKGLRDLRELLAHPGTSIAALDLATSPGERSRSRSARDELHPPSDAGEVLDAAARAAYRRRLQELDQEADDADAMGDAERSARLAAERDTLLSALTTAYGLGGRARRMGSPAERARTAVTTRIRDAIRRIRQADPDLGEHLARSVRTGTFCVYDPVTPVHWSVSDST